MFVSPILEDVGSSVLSHEHAGTKRYANEIVRYPKWSTPYDCFLHFRCLSRGCDYVPTYVYDGAVISEEVRSNIAHLEHVSSTMNLTIYGIPRVSIISVHLATGVIN